MSTAHSRLVARFASVVESGGERIAVEDDAETVTFTELGRRAASVAAELRRHGLADARIAMLVGQGSGWVEAFFGIVLAGGVAVPLSHLHPPPEQRWFVEASSARGLVVSTDLEQRGRALAGPLPLFSVEALRGGPADGFSPALRADSDAAVMLYTSGTTGKPKGALITHANLAWLAELLGRAWHWSEEDVLLHALPLHHLHGLGIALFVALLGGARTRVLGRFDAERLWEELGRATVLMGVPTMHKKLLDVFDAADAPTRARWAAHAARLRLVTSGSAALPLSVGERWRDLCGAYPLERFGMTEIGVGMTNPVDGPRVPGTCGPALPGMQIRIVDEAGRDVAPGQQGEIWIKGPTVFAGYDGMEHATRESFSDGWFKSGDTACFTTDAGYVKILGRTSVDILKSGGYKLSALEIEEVLREHPAVADAAVVGMPDETWGDLCVAALVAKQGRASELGEEAVRGFMKERIATYKVPKRVLVFDDLPRNAVGKVMKPELQRLLCELLAATPGRGA